MGKQSRFLRRAALRENQPDAGSDPPAQYGKTRRILWAAALVIVTLLNVVLLCCYVAIRRPAADPRSGEVEELIRRYFRTWSSQDMKGYGECFLANSSIQFVNADGKVEQSTLPAFLAYQGELLRTGPAQKEAPESLDIRFEANLARVVVYWKLTAGSRDVFGYDHFTLMKRDGKWGIVNLVFYETKP